MRFRIKLRNPPGMDSDSKSELEAAEAGADDEDDGSGKFHWQILTVSTFYQTLEVKTLMWRNGSTG